MSSNSETDFREDFGLGVVVCPKCGAENFKGHYMCFKGRCTQLLSGFVPIKTNSERYTGPVGFDMSKVTSGEIEAIAASSSTSEHALKRAGFQKYMDEINTSINHARTESDYNHYKHIRDTQVYPYYKKYNN